MHPSEKKTNWLKYDMLFERKLLCRLILYYLMQVIQNYLMFFFTLHIRRLNSTLEPYT